MRYWLAAILALLAGPVFSQNLVPPGEIVIHVNSDVRNTEFVEPLVCALTNVVRAPVRAKKIDIALTAELLESGTQYSPRKIVSRFAAMTAGQAELANPFRYLIVDHDLKVPDLNYVFAETYDPPASVISVTRLAPAIKPPVARLPPTVEPPFARKATTEITMPRIYKLMLKAVAVMAGLRSNGCVMMFPRSVAELDAKPAEYCSDDRAALVAARVLKEIPSTICRNVVAAQ
jgi:predicted Zn-dependent protease